MYHMAESLCGGTTVIVGNVPWQNREGGPDYARLDAHRCALGPIIVLSSPPEGFEISALGYTVMSQCL